MEVQPVVLLDPFAAANAQAEGNKDRRSKSFRSWLRYHRQNPHVYDLLVRIAREGKALGMSRWSIAAAFEIARWERRFDVKSGRKFKLPNEFRAMYSRLIMMQEPDLLNYFHAKKSSADYEMGWIAFKAAKKAATIQ